jgi:uncharacterized protein YegJ (DUF2314 family)
MRMLALSCLLFAAACGGSDSDKPPIINVKDTDQAMNAAMDEARAKVDQFVAALTKPSPKQKDFTFKKKFEEGGKVEYMWITDVRVKGETLTGKLNNEPRTMKKVRIGASVTIPKAEVADWMFVDDGRLVGGYTLRVLRNRMSASERKEFDQSVPFKID